MSDTQVASLYATIGVRMDSLERGLARTETLMLQAANKTERHAKRMNTSLALIGGSLAGATIMYAFTGMIRSAGNLDKTLSQLKAVTGANAAQMDAFRKAAMLAGTTTAFSVGQAAQAQVELAKAGMSTAQIMGGGFKSAMTLAAAGGMDLADASKTMANGLNLFNISAKDSSKIADALATAANTTTADVSDFAMALTQGGTAAKAAGLSFTDTMLVLESLAKIGVKNSDAGTSMKAAILALLTPTKQQAELTDKLGLSFVGANGKFKDAVKISAMLRAKLGDMTQAHRTNTLATIAGTDGVRALLALYNAGPATLKTWESQLSTQGTAAKQAKTMQDNLGTSIDKFRNSIEAGGISLATVFAPQIRAAADGIGNLIRELQDGGQAESFAQGISDAVGGVADTVKGAAPAFSLLGSALNMIGGSSIGVAVASFAALRLGVLGATSAVKAFTKAGAEGALAFNPLGAALIGLQVGVPIIAALVESEKSATAAAQDWKTNLDQVQSKLDSLQGTRIAESVAQARYNTAKADQKRLENEVATLVSKGKQGTKEYTDTQYRLTQAVQTTADAKDNLNKAQNAESDTITTAKAKIDGLSKAYLDAVETRNRLLQKAPATGKGAAVENGQTARDLAAANAVIAAYIQNTGRLAAAQAAVSSAPLLKTINDLRNGYQALTPAANKALAEIANTRGTFSRAAGQAIAIKLGISQDPHISDRLRELGALKEKADSIGKTRAVLQILADSASTEQALKRIRKLVGDIPSRTTATIDILASGMQLARKASGGRVTGGTPGRDSVLSLLTPGEVVLNSTQQHLVANGYTIEEALSSTGAAYAKGKPAAKKAPAAAPKPPIAGSNTPGKVSASVPKAANDKAQARWSTLSTAQQILMAGNDRAVTSAGLTPSTKDDAAALNKRISLLTAWVSKINGFASSNSPLSQALKATIESEKSGAFSGIASAKQSLQGLNPAADPTQLPASIDAALAQAQLDGDSAKQVDVLRQAESWYTGQLGKKPTAAQRASLLRSIASTRQQISDLTKPADAASVADATGAGSAPDAYALPDSLDAAMALAELTPDTGDDMTALQAEEAFYVGKLAEAQASGNSTDIARTARALKSVRDQMGSLSGSGAAAGGASGGIQGSVFEGYGSTAGNLVGSLSGGGSGSAGGGSAYASGGNAAGVVINVTVQGNVLSPDGLATSIVEPIRTQLIAIGQRNGSIFGGYA